MLGHGASVCHAGRLMLGERSYSQNTSSIGWVLSCLVTRDSSRLVSARRSDSWRRRALPGWCVVCWHLPRGAGRPSGARGGTPAVWTAAGPSGHGAAASGPLSLPPLRHGGHDLPHSWIHHQRRVTSTAQPAHRSGRPQGGCHVSFESRHLAAAG